jgi:dCMP deaminase
MLIINCGIIRVVCQKKYHDGHDSEELFAKAGVTLEFVSEEIQEYGQR